MSACFAQYSLLLVWLDQSHPQFSGQVSPLPGCLLSGLLVIIFLSLHFISFTALTNFPSFHLVDSTSFIFCSLCMCYRAWSCLTLQPHEPTRLLCPWDFQGKNTGVGCHFLLQEIFPTQGLNPGLPHCRQMLYLLSHRGSHTSISGSQSVVQEALGNLAIIPEFHRAKLLLQ